MKYTTLAIECPFCGQVSFVDVLDWTLMAYENGELAQDAFPYLSATERETIISGICADCQASIFSEIEEEEDWEQDVDEMGFDPYEGCYTFDC